MFYAYAIKSLLKKYIYVGLTNNIEKRLNQHNKGHGRTTSNFKPFKLIFLEQFNTRREARDQEKYLKSGCGKEYLKTII